MWNVAAYETVYFVRYYLRDVPSGRSETSFRNVDFDREKKYILVLVII